MNCRYLCKRASHTHPFIGKDGGREPGVSSMLRDSDRNRKYLSNLYTHQHKTYMHMYYSPHTSKYQTSFSASWTKNLFASVPRTVSMSNISTYNIIQIPCVVFSVLYVYMNVNVNVCVVCASMPSGLTVLSQERRRALNYPPTPNIANWFPNECRPGLTDGRGNGAR